MALRITPDEMVARCADAVMSWWLNGLPPHLAEWWTSDHAIHTARQVSMVVLKAAGEALAEDLARGEP